MLSCSVIVIVVCFFVLTLFWIPLLSRAETWLTLFRIPLLMVDIIFLLLSAPGTPRGRAPHLYTPLQLRCFTTAFSPIRSLHLAFGLHRLASGANAPARSSFLRACQFRPVIPYVETDAGRHGWKCLGWLRGVGPDQERDRCVSLGIQVPSQKAPGPSKPTPNTF